MRQLRFFVLALAALALFASCDQVLETFYPEFKKDFEGQKDAGITVNIVVESILFNNPSLLDSAKPIRVKLVPYYEMGPNEFFIDTGSIREKTIGKPDLQLAADGKYKKSAFFGGLYNAMWAAFVFVDKDNDNTIDYDEISRLGTFPGDQNKNKVDFRYEIRPTELVARLDQFSKIDGWILDQLNNAGGGGGGSPMLPVAGIGPTPGTVQVNTNVGIWADGSYDPDGYIAEYIWVVKKDNVIVPPGEQRRGQSDFNFTFASVGNYEIILRVKDNGGNISPEFRRWITVASSVTSKRVHITGSNTSGVNDKPVRFGLVNRFSYNMPIVIDTFSTSFDNSIDSPPPGDWFLIAWIDDNWDMMPDSGERGVVASNSTQNLFEVLPVSSVSVEYLNLDSVNMDLVEMVANIGPATYLPSDFTSGGGSTELANNTPISVQANVNLGIADGTQVRIEVMSPWNDPIASFVGTISGGTLAHTFSGLNYHPTPGQDSVFISVDSNNDAIFENAGDEYYGEYIFLLTGNTTYTLNATSADLLPY